MLPTITEWLSIPMLFTSLRFTFLLLPKKMAPIRKASRAIPLWDGPARSLFDYVCLVDSPATARGLLVLLAEEGEVYVALRVLAQIGKQRVSAHHRAVQAMI